MGTISGFVEHLLPDLRDEEVRKKVMATHRTLASKSDQPNEGSDAN
ncbi:MAG TPA: hypothetical protein VNL74_14215 [Methylococcus sp.]|nr:hypothetical protein [Methylococcus sp.]